LAIYAVQVAIAILRGRAHPSYRGKQGYDSFKTEGETNKAELFREIGSMSQAR